MWYLNLNICLSSFLRFPSKACRESASYFACMGGEKALGSVPKEIRALHLLHLISVKSNVKWHWNSPKLWGRDQGKRVSLLHVSTGISNVPPPGTGEVSLAAQWGFPVLCPGHAGRWARISCTCKGFKCNWFFSSPQTAPEVEEVKSSSTLLNVVCAHIFILRWLLHPQHSCLQIRQLSSFYGICKSHSMFL